MALTKVSYSMIDGGYISVSDFGAKGDYYLPDGSVNPSSTDDSAAIQAAINFASLPGRTSSVVYFPSGVYKIGTTLTVSENGVELRGETDAGRNANEAVFGIGSAQLVGVMTDGSPIIKFSNPSKVLYGNKLSNLRISAPTSLMVKPVAIQIRDCSEIYLSDFSIFGGCLVGVEIVGGTLIYMDSFAIADCGRSLKFNKGDFFGFVYGLYVQKGNFFNCTYDHVLFNCASNVFFSDTWMEYAQRYFNVEQILDETTEVNITLKNVDMSTATGAISGYAPQDPTYNKINNRMLKATAIQSSSSKLSVRMSASDCSTYLEGATFAIEYVKGTNSNILSRLDECTFYNLRVWGVQTAGIYSDTTFSSVSAYGYIYCVDSLISPTPAPKPLVTSLVQLNAMMAVYGYTDMSQGRPLRLGEKPAIDQTISGQLYNDTTFDRAAFTANGKTSRISRSDFEIVTAPFDFVASAKNRAETIYFNGTLTASRKAVLSATDTYDGQKIKIVRSSSSGGPSFALNVESPAGVLKALFPGQWCEVQSDLGNWYLIASGTL